LSEKATYHFEKFGKNIFDPVCPIVKFQKNRNLESGVVLLMMRMMMMMMMNECALTWRES